MRGPGEVDAHGNVQLSGSGALGDGLADLIKSGLTPKGGKAPRVRADTFGYLQRCWPYASPVDAEEARASAAMPPSLRRKGDASASVILVRVGNAPDAYRSDCARADFRQSPGAPGMCPPSSSQARTTSAPLSTPIAGRWWANCRRWRASSPQPDRAHRSAARRRRRARQAANSESGSSRPSCSAARSSSDRAA